MSHLQSCLELIHKEIGAFKEENKGHNLYDPVAYILSLGGKRLRPALSLLASKIFGAKEEQAIHAALGIEVFHNFTLMHDDIMDKAPLRRGKATVHTKWDVNSAILSGDAMLVQAYQLIARSPKNVMPQVLERFSTTALEVCEGQQLDMDFESRNDVQVDEYIEMIRLKTSVLLAAALEIGAMIGEANEEDAQKLYNFGQDLGIAFQLRDDYLDLFGDSEKVGKQIGGDILADKKTYLLIRSFEKADQEETKILNQYIGVVEVNPEEKITRIKSLMEKLEVDRELIKLSDQYYHQALESLKSLSVQNEFTEELKVFATQLMVREH